MQRMTDRAKAHHRRERWKRWVEKNIIAEDPRTLEEQMADENSKDRSSLWFLLVVATSVLIYVVAGLIIFS